MVWNSTRSLLCREDAVAEGETYKALSSAKREELKAIARGLSQTSKEVEDEWGQLRTALH